MHLYAHLDKLREPALYCDTDRVIFVQKTDEPPLIECGKALGDMTSELKGNVYISEFVSLDPKNYAYKLCNSVTGEGCVKCGVLHLIIRRTNSRNLTRIKTWY